MNADSIKIETDEDGFHLVVSVERGHGTQTTDYRITDLEAFYDHVKAAILPWLMERDEAKRDFRSVYRETFGEDAPEDGIAQLQAAAYSPEDPKHPDYHSVHADLYDQREGK